jgi:hypothetical protein
VTGGEGAQMSTKHVRRTGSNKVVVTVSAHLHKPGTKGRACGVCEAIWTAQRDGRGDLHVWKNNVPSDGAMLDWTGNNVAVECC